MADAAALLLLLAAKALGRRIDAAPPARIVDAATASDDLACRYSSGCVAATRKLMARQTCPWMTWTCSSCTEAFAATLSSASWTLGIPNDKLNVNGGVIALGHPGRDRRFMTIWAGTLLDELQRRLPAAVSSPPAARRAGSALLRKW